MKKLTKLLMICAVAAGVTPAAAAAEAEIKPKVETVKVSGEVAAVSSSGIAVQYGSSKEGAAKEIYLPISDATKLQRFQSPAQLKVGDTVSVVFERKFQEPEKGKKVYLGAEAVEVALLKQAPSGAGLVSKGEGAQ